MNSERELMTKIDDDDTHSAPTIFAVANPNLRCFQPESSQLPLQIFASTLFHRSILHDRQKMTPLQTDSIQQFQQPSIKTRPDEKNNQNKCNNKKHCTRWNSKTSKLYFNSLISFMCSIKFKVKSSPSYLFAPKFKKISFNSFHTDI